MPDDEKQPTQQELVENLRKAIDEYVEEKKLNQPLKPMTIEEFKDNIAALAAKEPDTSPKAEAVKKAFLALRETYGRSEDVAARLASFVNSLTQRYGKQFLADAGKEQAEILAGRKTWAPEAQPAPQTAQAQIDVEALKEITETPASLNDKAPVSPQLVDKETIRKIRESIDAVFNPAKSTLDLNHEAPAVLDPNTITDYSQRPIRPIDIDTVKDYPKGPEDLDVKEDDKIDSENRLETIGKQINELGATISELETAALSTNDPQQKAQLEEKLAQVREAMARLTQEKAGIKGPEILTENVLAPTTAESQKPLVTDEPAVTATAEFQQAYLSEDSLIAGQESLDGSIPTV